MENVKLKHNPLVQWREDGECVSLIYPLSGEICLLNEVGAYIWKFCQGEKTVGEFANAVRDHYKISDDLARADTEEFLEMLIKENLLHVVE